MKKFFVSLILMAGIATGAARAENPFFQDVFDYQSKSCQAVTSATSACNKGAESFSSFIKRWNSSKTFRKTRVAVTANTHSFSGATTKSAKKKEILEYLDMASGMLPLKVYKSRISNDCKEYATWFGVTANRVGWKFSEDCSIDPESDFGGSDAVFGFERIGGKWYLTCILLAG